jgi:hypothetical protein
MDEVKAVMARRDKVVSLYVLFAGSAGIQRYSLSSRTQSGTFPGTDEAG